MLQKPLLSDYLLQSHLAPKGFNTNKYYFTTNCLPYMGSNNITGHFMLQKPLLSDYLLQSHLAPKGFNTNKYYFTTNCLIRCVYFMNRAIFFVLY